MPSQDPAGTEAPRRNDTERTVVPAAGPSGAPPVAIDTNDTGPAGPAEPDPAEAEFERLTGHPIDARPTPPSADEMKR